MQVILMNSQRKLLPKSFALCSKISQVDKTHPLLGFGASGRSHGNMDRSSFATKSGLDELKSNLEDDQVQYGYLRVTSGDSESKRAKFVFISWVGERVGPLKRAKVSVHKASVKQIIQAYAIEVHAEKQDELEESEILSKVRKAGGADYSGNLANN